MTRKQSKTFKIQHSNRHFGRTLAQKLYGFVGNRIGDTVRAHERYGNWMTRNYARVVDRLERRLREQRNDPVLTAFGSSLQFNNQFLSVARHDEVRRSIRLAGLLEDFPTVITEEFGYDPPELGLIVDR